MSSSSSDDGCGGLILLAIIIWLVFYATGADIKEFVGSLFGSETGKDAETIWVENYPWSHSEVDAVKKCMLAIESRNWDNYQRCFEPSTIMDRIEPGLPGKFSYIDYLLLESDDIVATVWVSGIWIPSELTGIYEEIYIDEEITIVKARKGMLDDINVDIDIAASGWFVAYTEVNKLPFDFSSQLLSLQVTPTLLPTLTPTITPTPLIFYDTKRK